MSLPALIFTSYVAGGLLVAFVALLSRRKSIKDPNGSMAEPPLFWILLLLWPVMIVVWLVERKKPDEDTPFPTNKEPNKPLEPTPMSVTSRAPSSTSRASHGRGSS